MSTPSIPPLPVIPPKLESIGGHMYAINDVDGNNYPMTAFVMELERHKLHAFTAYRRLSDTECRQIVDQLVYMYRPFPRVDWNEEEYKNLRKEES